MTLQDRLKRAADQLTEDAADCWGIRRKHNLEVAARLLLEAANKLKQQAAR